MLAARQAATMRRGPASAALAPVRRAVRARAAPSARPSRLRPSSPLIAPRASAPSSHGQASPAPGKKSPAPVPPALAKKDGPASAVSSAAPPAPPPLSAAGKAPSLFGMLSSLWPVGGAASRAAQAREVERRPPSARPMASRLELEAELAACEAEGAPPLVVVFSTAWCGPCKLFVEDLAKVASARGGAGAGLRVVKVDIEQREGGLAELASSLGVTKLPTAMFCGGKGGGAPAVRTQGLLRRAVLEDLIDNRVAFLGTNLGEAVTY